MRFTSLAISDPRDLVFGRAPKPVKSGRGLEIGGGLVYPELNFTLPAMAVTDATRDEVFGHYRGIVEDALTRADELHLGGLVLEFETLLEMTLDPSLGVGLVTMMNDICEDFHARRGIAAEIRLTPNDTRDFERPVRVRTSSYLQNMFRLFEDGARAGGNFLSIESTGGKEVHDEALMNCDVPGVVFSLAVLGVRDMRFLWRQIVDIARRTGRIAGGDTACGFANTAMVLAEKRYIPRVFAAIDRVLSVVRTLAAVEEGATGPDKDCGYEGPYLKAIAGIPISMEGKTAACAHLSPVGNVSSACCDLWSNESVQNVKLLGAMAPTVSLEQLIYDARLLNVATATGETRRLQRLLIESDVHLDPQALVLAPEVVIPVAAAIVAEPTPLSGALAGARKALDLIEDAWKSGSLALDEREVPWIDGIRAELDTIPSEESAFVEMMEPRLDKTKVLLSEYGL